MPQRCGGDGRAPRRRRSRPTRSTRRGRSRARAAAAGSGRGRCRPPSPASARPGPPARRRSSTRLPETDSTTMSKSRTTISAWRNATARSFSTMSLSVPRPMRTRLPEVLTSRSLVEVVPLGRLVTFWTLQRIARSGPVSPSSRRRRRCARSAPPAARRTGARGCAARRPSAPCSAGRAARAAAARSCG